MKRSSFGGRVKGLRQSFPHHRGLEGTDEPRRGGNPCTAFALVSATGRYRGDLLAFANPGQDPCERHAVQELCAPPLFSAKSPATSATLRFSRAFFHRSLETNFT